MYFFSLFRGALYQVNRPPKNRQVNKGFAISPPCNQLIAKPLFIYLQRSGSAINVVNNYARNILQKMLYQKAAQKRHSKKRIFNLAKLYFYVNFLSQYYYFFAKQIKNWEFQKSFCDTLHHSYIHVVISFVLRSDKLQVHCLYNL